jgi:hypothetical protein
LDQFCIQLFVNLLLGWAQVLTTSIQTSIDHTIESIKAIPDNIARVTQKQMDITTSNITGF